MCLTVYLYPQHVCTYVSLQPYSSNGSTKMQNHAHLYWLLKILEQKLISFSNHNVCYCYSTKGCDTLPSTYINIWLVCMCVYAFNNICRLLLVFMNINKPKWSGIKTRKYDWACWSYRVHHKALFIAW